MGVEKRNLAMKLWSILLTLHLLACFWGAAALFNDMYSLNWIFKAGLQDEDEIYLYITSLYFSTTTTLTVGYGDILP